MKKMEIMFSSKKMFLNLFPSDSMTMVLQGIS